MLTILPGCAKSIDSGQYLLEQGNVDPAMDGLILFVLDDKVWINNLLPTIINQKLVKAWFNFINNAL
jgi:hypothetical protein